MIFEIKVGKTKYVILPMHEMKEISITKYTLGINDYFTEKFDNKELEEISNFLYVMMNKYYLNN